MRIKKILALLLSAAMIFTLCSCEYLEEFLEDDLQADVEQGKFISHFIDVGQGDSEFLELPTGETMLIDASTSAYGSKIVKYIKDLGYDHIDYLVATHPHADHIGGMKEVVNSLSIGSIYMPKAETTTKTYENLLQAIQDKGLKIKTAKAGMSITSSVEQDMDIDILAPIGTKYSGLNNYSIVIMLRFKNNKFLYMGDAEQESEAEILERWNDLSADVIKVGHHGSSTSSSEEFVKAVSAKYAVFSLGKDNDYHHPHQQTVNRWKKIGAEMYRTDERGTIKITSDGSELSVETEK
ncbi:MAG: MBL fold metallo-hydrolase [Clostridia bacterium]|nr:MBL fold metallo-hydrolase [Clostridia bacterium]MBR2175657.1 MBL fold metallo-hydrolase [Clostridia bacterium]